jgi:pimeloyl-ACP methyl ester carboxylesterase
MSTLPTILLVHGAWHTPSNYQSYIKALQAQGFKVHCPQLPTCNKALNGAGTYADDVACVRKTLETLVNSGDRVLMVMHSYGGAVGTGAAEDLSFAGRRTAGQPGGVIHLLYLCAYILAPGSTIWGVVQEAGFDKVWDQYIDTAEDGSTAIKDPGLAFFSENTDQATVDKALETLVRFPSSVFTTPTVGFAWKIIPTTYVSTTQDYAVPKTYQDIMLARVQEEGVEVKVKEFDADHSLFITREKEMVKAALDAASDKRTSI